MNVPTIIEPREQARAKYREYQQATRHSRNKADELLKAAYYHIARGRAILRLETAMQAAGVDDTGRPRLAIARASAEFVFHRQRYDGRDYFTERDGDFYAERPGPGRIILATGTLPANSRPDRTTARAMVPSVPPRLRPDKLHRYHILWEAEWTNIPPTDPLLLRSIGHGVYVVLAAWDLTELERLVLGADRAASR